MADVLPIDRNKLIESSHLDTWMNAAHHQTTGLRTLALHERLIDGCTPGNECTFISGRLG